jgi:hypothetical protein
MPDSHSQWLSWRRKNDQRDRDQERPTGLASLAVEERHLLRVIARARNGVGRHGLFELGELIDSEVEIE